MNFRPSKRSAGERGQILVELAVALPLVLFTAVAAMGLGLAAQKRVRVERAAAAAARVAIVRPDLAQTEAYRALKAAEPGIVPADLRVTVAPLGGRVQPFINPYRVAVVRSYALPAGFGWAPEIKIRAEYTIDRWNNGIFFDAR